MFDKVRAYRFIFMAEKPNAGTITKRPHAFVCPFIQMVLFCSGWKIRIRFLIFEQHTIAIEDDMRNETAWVCKRDATLLHDRRIWPGCGCKVEGEVCSFNIFGKVDMRNIKGIAVFIETMGGAICRQQSLKCNARHIEKIADCVLVFGSSKPANTSATSACKLCLLGF